MIIHKKCEVCGKMAQVSSESKVEQLKFTYFMCGHMIITPIVEANYEDITSLDGKHPYKYQVTGAKFIEESGGRCLLADEMGVGKTIQFLIWVSKHPEAQPFAVFCKSGLRTQWCHEIIRWCGDEFVPQVIENSKQKLIKGFKCYVISLDILRRFKEENGMSHQFETIGVKTLCIDECQQIKNSESQRTNCVREIVKVTDNIVGLSGTPIKNNAAEYFPILNILRPEKFPRQNMYIWNWCDSYWDGYKQRTGGIRNPKAFQEYTKDFIIRRTRSEVLPDLPQITRNFQFNELGAEVEKAYLETLAQFQEYYNTTGDSGFTKSSNVLAYLSKMRHLTGIAKINPVVEFVEQFLEETDRKITLFVHHIDVGQALFHRLSDLSNKLKVEGHSLGVDMGKRVPEPLQLTAELDADARSEVVDKFMGPDYRVLIASTLASGEGLNLQNCSDCIVVERQWNPANEEQAEARFIRIGQLADKVTGTYFVAVGTVDEFFSELVERKREIVASALGGEAVKWDESSLMRELAEVLATKGGQKWGL